MQEDDPDFAAEMAALKAAFRARLAEDREAFSAPLAAPRQPPPLEALRMLALRAHQLAGAAGSFEEPALSQAARRFEELCEPSADAAATAAALAQLVREVERAIAAAG
jgi:HPt (histidine-containing phosphotransfer) domain-containing protein